MGKGRLYIPVAGTWSRKYYDHVNAWYRQGSLFDETLKASGWTRVNQEPGIVDPGFWSGDLGGLLAQQLCCHNSRRPWLRCARELTKFIRNRRQRFCRYKEVVIIAHSHGGQGVALALARFLKKGEVPSNLRVITVDMPVRRKMKVVYQDAIQKVGGQWHHLFSEPVWRHPYATRWRWLGCRFGPRQLDGAGRNTEIPGGHAGILSQIDLMPLWPLILKLPKGPTSRRWELTCGRVFLLLFLVVGFLTLAAKCCAPSGMRQAVLVGDGAPAEEHRAGVVLTSSGDPQPRQTRDQHQDGA